MKIKTLVGLGLSMVIAGAALVGCGSSNTNKAESSPSAEAPVVKQEAPAEKEETPAKEEKTETLEGSINGSGSSALLPLAQDAAKKFKEVYPNISVTLNGGGSGTGLKQVSDGTVDIGNSDVFAEEKLDEAQAKELVDHKVCIVSMAAVVNNEVGEVVSNLTKQQLIDIFTGKITNWKEVGGPDIKILLVTRPDSSGTRALFTQWALDGNSENSNAAYLETDNSGELLETVKSNPGAIGYVAYSYLVNNTDVTPISIDGVEPTLENTYSGDYPVWGYEHMYTKGEPNEVVKAFLDFITSETYGESMEAQGYGVASKMQVTR